MILEDYFEQFAQAEDAFYWKSADGQTTLMGFGIKSTQNVTNMNALKAWQAEQVVPVFGGFSFDDQTPVNQSELLSGFIAPRVVIDFTTGKMYGDASYLDTLTFNNLTQPIARVILDESSDEAWVSRVSDIIQVMNDDVSKQKTVLGAQKIVMLSKALDETQLLRDLNTQQPNSYHVMFKRSGTLFVSATPERLVSVSDNQFATAAVAGSTPRGVSNSEDENLGQALIADEKNREEHALVVNEIVRRVGKFANVSWESTPILLQTPQIQHLYTPIVGQLKSGSQILDVVKALHPTPALGGVPRDWAMATIKAVEKTPRGLFASPIGVVWPNGDGEFAIGIRAMVLQDKTATLFAGAGILAASNAQQEWAEINLKMTPMMALIKEQIND